LKLVAVVIVFHAILTMKTSIIKASMGYFLCKARVGCKKLMSVFISSTVVILFITVPFIHLYVLFATFIGTSLHGVLLFNHNAKPIKNNAEGAVNPIKDTMELRIFAL